MHRILLIDDHDISLFVAQHIIKGFEKKTETILQPSGFSALNYLRESAKSNEGLPSIILLDVDMPVVNGMQFLEEYAEMVKIFPKKPVIYILSGHDEKVKFKKWMEKGIVKSYLMKPLNHLKIQQILEDFIKQTLTKHTIK